MSKEDGRPEDEAWRDIVENFGERAELDPTEIVDGRDGATPSQFTPFEQARFDGGPTSSYLDALDALDAHGDEEPGHFHPEIEAAPPLPWPRRLAWIGVIGAPAFLVVWVIVRDFLPFGMPTLLMGGLVLLFIASFGYLVATMPRHREDPFDDGARL